MNILFKVSIFTGLLSSLCLCSSVRTIALIPKGLRACVPNERGLESFTLYGHVRRSGSQPVKYFEGTVREPSDGLWCYHNQKLTLNIGDELVYWYRVVKFGNTTQSETISKRLQAADFLDESGLYVHQTDTPPTPCGPSARFGCPQVTNFPITPVTPRGDGQVHSWMRPKNGVEVYIAQPLRPGYGVSTTARGLSENDADRTLQTINIGEDARKRCQARNKGNTSDKKDYGYVPFPPLDVAPENGGVFHEKPSTKIDVRIDDSIHIDISIERKGNPCDDIINRETTAEIEDRIRGDFFSKLDTQNKTCENLIGLEKKFSNAVLNSLKESITKANSLENTLDDAIIQNKYYKKIVKELLKILDSLRGKTTNKLILQSSVPLVDYRKTLRDVLEQILDIDPESYHIIRSDIEGNRTISFELNNYGEKLKVFLAGRIKLANTRFEMFDFDLTSELQ